MLTPNTISFFSQKMSILSEGGRQKYGIIPGMDNPHVLFLRSSTAAERYRGIREYAQQHGWWLFVAGNVENPPVDWRGDGVLFAAEATEATERFLKSMRRRHIPVVDLSEHLRWIPMPRVTVDNAAIGQLAARHFLAQSYRHLAFFSLNWSSVHEIRSGAFAAELAGMDVAIWAWNRSSGRNTNDSRAFTKWLEGLLRKAPKPIGVFCYNDSDAVHVVDACRSEGLAIPDEVAILGVDDETLICESQTVPLSSIRHNFRRIGLEGAVLLAKIMDGKQFSKTVYIPPDGITLRKSTDAFGSENPLMAKAFEYIDRNLRQMLYELFTREIGRPVGAEVLRRRLALVKTRLSESRDTVDQVARQCGFCNTSYLIHVFRRYEGMTPLHYRKTVQSASPDK